MYLLCGTFCTLVTSLQIFNFDVADINMLMSSRPVLCSIYQYDIASCCSKPGMLMAWIGRGGVCWPVAIGSCQLWEGRRAAAWGTDTRLMFCVHIQQSPSVQCSLEISRIYEPVHV